MQPRNEKAMRAETVSTLVALSGAYTRTSGHRVLKHWSRFQAALQASLTGVGSFGAWAERIRLHLHIETPSSSLCSALEQLESVAEDAGYDFYSWLYLVRTEVVWYIVQVRLESERRSAIRKNEGLVDAVLAQGEPPEAIVSAEKPRRQRRK